MFLSIEQITLSLDRLSKLHPFFGMSYLAFKQISLPVGQTKTLVFSQVADALLTKHYKVDDYKGYFNPFQTSDKDNRWTAARYASTSLQRITTDTFGNALIHAKKSQEWGWQSNYVPILKQHLGGHRVPSFDLAVWLFRYVEWADHVTPEEVQSRLFREYEITSVEQTELFDPVVPPLAHPWLKTTEISNNELFQAIGRPPGVEPEEGAALKSLSLHEVGPATDIVYEPADRLNVITGDNSLGKTFLLECIWWTLTGSWIDYTAQPRLAVAKDEPFISYEIATRQGTSSYTSRYNWDRQQWRKPNRREAVSGLVIYARSDGSFAVWDPARASLSEQDNRKQGDGSIFLSRSNIWDGVVAEGTTGKTQWLCNGLLRDWASWQAGGRYEKHFKALVASLERLSPSDGETLKPGELLRLPFDSRDVPSLKLFYGDVPVLYASAGVQRAVALAYMLVWTWFEHLDLSSLIRRQPQKRLVLLIDEVEAHLHPRWQRVIIPSIMNVIAELSDTLAPQVHAATHSPMVLASMETVYDPQRDALHHLKVEKELVELEEIAFVKRGRSDLWLMSPVFGLEQARSLPAERAIGEAKALQEVDTPEPSQVNLVNSKLVRYLAPDDDFWPRWRFFAEQHGVKE